jgi:ATP-dependent RNA helicase DeaD
MIQPLLDALAERGYDTMTAVQEAVTKPELAGADLLVSAQTGSGKTVGFGLAIGDTLLAGETRLGAAGAPLALIVAPTRELALQVMRELGWLYAKTGAVVASCVGGTDMRDERRALDRGAHLVVGTPGRLRDHIQRGSLQMGSLRAIVLDEADEMLDLGFREDLEFMLAEAPEDRRTLMFSATVPPAIARLATQYQRDAVRVQTTSGREQHADIAYQALTVSPFDAEHAIINTLLYHDSQNAIVFCNTRAAVTHLTARLSNRGFHVVALSGELTQKERTHALQAMRDGRARVCVATDVAARGIDLPNLELVIHAELPSNGETLLHRSGRTGRAGRKGVSALIVTPKLRNKADRLLKTARVVADWRLAATADEIAAQEQERLLNDPVWTDEVSDEVAEFAAQLAGMHSAERIAAAYLKLYKSRRSAPEELAPVDTPAPRKEKQEFGPSRWFSLSVGRDAKAEPRWLLPLVCKAGGFDKTAIGAIRVRDNESFVEIAESAADGFVAAIGPGMTLEDGIKVAALDTAPDFGPARPRAPREDRPSREDRPARKPREDYKPREDRKPRDDYKPRESYKPREDRPARVERPAHVETETAAEPRTERKPRHKASDRPAAKPVWKKPEAKEDRPRRERDDSKPYEKRGPKPERKPYDKAERKPYEKSERKPYDKADRKPFDKEGRKPYDKADRKPYAKSEGKPGRKGDFTPKDKPAKPSRAADASKRFTPPGVKTSPRKPGSSSAPGRKKP